MSQPQWGAQSSVRYFDGADPRLEASHASAMLSRMESGAPVDVTVNAGWVEVSEDSPWVTPICFDASAWTPQVTTIDALRSHAHGTFPLASTETAQTLQRAASSLMRDKVRQSLNISAHGRGSHQSVQFANVLLETTAAFVRAYEAANQSNMSNAARTAGSPHTHEHASSGSNGRNRHNGAHRNTTDGSSHHR